MEISRLKLETITWRGPFWSCLGFLFALNANAGNLGPERVITVLKEQPSQVYDFFISFNHQAEVENKVKDISESAIPLELLNGYVSKMSVADAFALAGNDEIEWVWYVHPQEAKGTITALEGLQYAVNTIPPPNLVNLSIGPPTRFYQLEKDDNEPMIRALDAAAELGFISIVAIGNVGEAAPGYVNPWSTTKKVISVGAWDHRTNSVWSHSSRAKPEHPSAWPDVIAHGVDVIGPHPVTGVKTPKQRQRDESNSRFRRQIPEQDWNLYTIKSGTSQAAAVVSGAAAQILRYLNGFIRQHKRKPGDFLFSIEAGANRMSEYDSRVERLTGTATATDEGGAIYEYRLVEPWRLVKQILIDTAWPIEDSVPWEAGAGIVDPVYISKQFGQFGVEAPKILPVKVK